MVRARMSRWWGLVCAGLLLVPIGCRPPPPGPLDDLPSVAGLATDPLKVPATGPELPAEVGLAQILVTYKGAFEPQVRARFDVHQARRRAERLAALARTREHSFAQLAERYSDDPATSQQGGRLGVYSRGELHPDVERAAFSLGLGQVSDPIHTPRGFRIITRLEPFQAQSSEIVITYTGAIKYTPRVPRDREEASTLARQIRERLRAGGSFAAEAFAHSDQSTWPGGGFLPIFERGTQHPEFENIVWNLAPGQVSEVLETPTGFHIVARWPVRRIRLRRAAFPFLPEGAPRPVEPVPTRAEARSAAEAFLRRVREPGADFVAEAASVVAAGQEFGPRSSWLDRSVLPYPVNERAFELEVGQVSDVLATESGFVVIKRVP